MVQWLAAAAAAAAVDDDVASAVAFAAGHVDVPRRLLVAVVVVEQ